jgi:putative IMPACT (imprinted ancient) family translation regulator
VIEAAELFEYKEEIEEQISCEYSDIRLVEYECEALNITIIQKIFAQNAIYTIKAPKEDLKLFFEKMKRVIKVEKKTTP